MTITSAQNRQFAPQTEAEKMDEFDFRRCRSDLAHGGCDIIDRGPFIKPFSVGESSFHGILVMPEIDMRSPLHPGMTALLMARIPTPAVQELIVTGTRYGGALAAEKGIVDGALAEDELLGAAVAHAGGLASKAHPSMGALKRGMYGLALAALAEPLGDLGRH